MTTSPRLKYPLVAGIGITVYLVTTNVRAMKIAAAASSRALMEAPSFVMRTGTNERDARTRASSGALRRLSPPSSSHTDCTVDPGIPPGHGPGAPGPHGLSPPIGNRPGLRRTSPCPRRLRVFVLLLS